MEHKTAGLDIPITTIPNWADLELVSPANRDENRLLKELDIADKFVLMYAGNIGHPTDIESIVECARLLRYDDRFHFVFIGSGAKKAWLDAAVVKNRLSNVSVLGSRPRTEQQEFLNACDIGLISLVPKMWGTAMPSRTYNILAAGKPILALTEGGSELARVIDEEHVGWHIPPGDPHALLKLLLQIHDARDLLPEMGVRAREAALSKYSLETAIQRYRAELAA
jgi:glycosyltransferase involved in cell wall biosynthesis